MNNKQIRSGIRQHDERVADKAPGGKMVITTMPDGGGLRLEIRDSGRPKWVFRYSRPATGKANEMRIGTYPDIPLSRAREIASGLRAKVQENIDPQVAKVEAIKVVTAEAEKKARTFGVLVHEFLDSQDWAGGTEKLNRGRVKKYMVRMMNMQLDEITPRFLVEDVLKPIR